MAGIGRRGVAVVLAGLAGGDVLVRSLPDLLAAADRLAVPAVALVSARSLSSTVGWLLAWVMLWAVVARATPSLFPTQLRSWARTPTVRAVTATAAVAVGVVVEPAILAVVRNSDPGPLPSTPVSVPSPPVLVALGASVLLALAVASRHATPSPETPAGDGVGGDAGDGPGATDDGADTTDATDDGADTTDATDDGADTTDTTDDGADTTDTTDDGADTTDTTDDGADTTDATNATGGDGDAGDGDAPVPGDSVAGATAVAVPDAAVAGLSRPGLVARWLVLVALLGVFLAEASLLYPFPEVMVFLAAVGSLWTTRLPVSGRVRTQASGDVAERFAAGTVAVWGPFRGVVTAGYVAALLFGVAFVAVNVVGTAGADAGDAAGPALLALPLAVAVPKAVAFLGGTAATLAYLLKYADRTLRRIPYRVRDRYVEGDVAGEAPPRVPGFLFPAALSSVAVYGGLRWSDPVALSAVAVLPAVALVAAFVPFPSPVAVGDDHAVPLAVTGWTVALVAVVASATEGLATGLLGAGIIGAILLGPYLPVAARAGLEGARAAEAWPERIRRALAAAWAAVAAAGSLLAVVLVAVGKGAPAAVLVLGVPILLVGGAVGVLAVLATALAAPVVVADLARTVAAVPGWLGRGLRRSAPVSEATDSRAD